MLLHFTPYQEPSPRIIVKQEHCKMFHSEREITLRRDKFQTIYGSTMLYTVGFCEDLGCFLFLLKSSTPVAIHLIA